MRSPQTETGFEHVRVGQELRKDIRGGGLPGDRGKQPESASVMCSAYALPTEMPSMANVTSRSVPA